MCGIFGRLEPPGVLVDGALLRRQTDTLRHRGPDAGGYWLGSLSGPHTMAVDDTPQTPTGAHLALGHRRLSIVDLSTAATQPLADVTGRAWVVFNGEIYNHAALRQELLALGAKFETDHSDTEVLLNAWIYWGRDCLRRLRGMFAFVLVDLKEGVALLARDRLGKKPLYFTRTPQGGLMAASELKALVEDSATPRRVDPVALAEYLACGYINGPRTIYDGVFKLPPAHAAVAQLRQPGQWQTWRYWTPRIEPQEQNPEDWRERFEHTLQEATALRLMADVPVGAFLSGGIDSTRVVRGIHQAGARLSTFSIGFEEAAFNELPYADQAAARYDTDHHTQIVGPQHEDVLDLLSWHYDEPFGDSSAIPTYALCKFARQGVTVALSGDGGDEITAGYGRYRYYHQAGQLFGLIPEPLRRYLIAPLVSRLVPDGIRGAQLLKSLGMGERDRYLHHMMPPQAYQLLADGLKTAVGPLYRQQFESAWAFGPTGRGRDVERMQLCDVITYLPEDILTKVDRASMAVALEARCPLLDHEVVEAALNLPRALTFGGGEQKVILKQPLRAELGEAFVNRPKMGFGVPIGQWFSGPWRGRIERMLGQGSVLPQEVIHPARLQALAAAHGGIRNFSQPLYFTLMLALWWERWNPTGVADVKPVDLL